MKDFENAVLDHIAIAVESIEASKKVYEDMGFSFADHQEIVEEQGVKTAFAKVDNQAKIELLEPIDESGPIRKYLEKNGQGIHHLCFRVADVVAKQKELEEKGYRLIYPRPKMGAGNCLVNFVHPKSTGGVLIEISQKAS